MSAAVTAILEIVASVFGYLSVRGIDAIVGKWLAYAVCAWELRGSERSKQAFADTIKEIKAGTPEKAKAWDDWRKRSEIISRA